MPPLRPSRVVRGKTCDYICDWDGCDVEGFTSELSAAAADAYCSDLWGEGCVTAPHSQPSHP